VLCGMTRKIESGLHCLWEDPSAPALIEVTIDTFANVYPKMAFGRPLTEMNPMHSRSRWRVPDIEHYKTYGGKRAG
jgi:hypothetical protein